MKGSIVDAAKSIPGVKAAATGKLEVEDLEVRATTESFIVVTNLQSSLAQRWKKKKEKERRKKKEKRRKVAARSGLKSAERCRDIKKLQEALAEGRDAGLENYELKRAENILAEEERTLAARSGLQSVERSRDIPEVESAIAEGRGAGLEKDELVGMLLLAIACRAVSIACRSGATSKVATRCCLLQQML